MSLHSICLISAAAQGHGHILDWLKGAGANMSLRNIAGKTPCDVARRFGNRNCVKILGGNPGNFDRKPMSRDMIFPTMWYVRQAKPQISLPIGTV